MHNPWQTRKHDQNAQYFRYIRRFVNQYAPEDHVKTKNNIGEVHAESTGIHQLQDLLLFISFFDTRQIRQVKSV